MFVYLLEMNFTMTTNNYGEQHMQTNQLSDTSHTAAHHRHSHSLLSVPVTAASSHRRRHLTSSYQILSQSYLSCQIKLIPPLLLTRLVRVVKQVKQCKCLPVCPYVICLSMINLI